MYITFNYRCSPCDVTEERFVKRAEMNAQHCAHCETLLVRLPANPKTHFRFADAKLKD